MPNRSTSAMPATIGHTVWSWPWTRHRPARLALYARFLGLNVETEHDGGWLLRLHRIEVAGHYREVRRYDRTVRYLQRGGPPRPPGPHRDLLAKLRTAASPANTEGGAHAGP